MATISNDDFAVQGGAVKALPPVDRAAEYQKWKEQQRAMAPKTRTQQMMANGGKDPYGMFVRPWQQRPVIGTMGRGRPRPEPYTMDAGTMGNGMMGSWVPLEPPAKDAAGYGGF